MSSGETDTNDPARRRPVTIDDKTYALDDGFMVIATENPIEQLGTYPLPEAQLGIQAWHDEVALQKPRPRLPQIEEAIAMTDAQEKSNIGYNHIVENTNSTTIIQNQ